MTRPGAAPDVMAIFNEALDQSSPSARDAYLDRACGGDLEIRARVETLLAAHERAGGFLEWAEVFGNLYGTCASETEKMLVSGCDVVLVIDVLWNMRDFDSWADAIPVLPVAALGIGALAKLLQERLPQRTAAAITAAWVAVTLVTALIYSTTYRDTRLVEQREAVTTVLARLPGHATILSIEAPQPLVLTGRTNPTRYQMFTGGMENYVDHEWPGGLEGYAVAHCEVEKTGFLEKCGVAKELRNLMLGSRTAEDAIAGMEWLYGEQKELARGGVAARD